MEDSNPLEYLTAKELSNLLKVSCRFIEDRCRANQLPGAVKIGKLWRIHRRTIEQHMARGGFLLEEPHHEPSSVTVHDESR